MTSYSDAVVAAETEAEAATIHPDEYHKYDAATEKWGDEYSYCWAHTSSQVTAKLIGVAVEGTVASVICASFHAG